MLYVIYTRYRRENLIQLSIRLISYIVLQAFVIYCFFQLLVGYMGGERSLLILLHGRPPKDAVFPFTLLRRELDLSDPYVFLFMKRGVLRASNSDPVIAHRLTMAD